MLVKSGYRDRLYAYIGGIIRAETGNLVAIGGIEDHVHLLLNVPVTISIPTLVRKIKSNSSRWLNKSIPSVSNFGWQNGYGVFSVSQSSVPNVVKYIKNQESHHKGRSFEEEYKLLLKMHNISYDEKYLFE